MRARSKAAIKLISAARALPQMSLTMRVSLVGVAVPDGIEFIEFG